MQLQEKGILSQLKEKWWKRGSQNCTSDASASSSGELTMAHVGGIFLVLLIGCSFAVILAIFEFIWNVRRVAVEEKVKFSVKSIIWKNNKFFHRKNISMSKDIPTVILVFNNMKKKIFCCQITPGEAFMAELKFALNIWAEEKPVKIAQSSSKSRSNSSGGIGNFVRAASTARSMVGSFLRLDSLDKLDKEKDNTPRKTSANNLPM